MTRKALIEIGVDIDRNRAESLQRIDRDRHLRIGSYADIDAHADRQ